MVNDCSASADSGSSVCLAGSQMACVFKDHGERLQLDDTIRLSHQRSVFQKKSLGLHFIGELQMKYQDAGFLPSGASFYTTFPKNGGRGKRFRTAAWC